jgi:hypothetical protein
LSTSNKGLASKAIERRSPWVLINMFIVMMQIGVDSTKPNLSKIIEQFDIHMSVVMMQIGEKLIKSNLSKNHRHRY